MLNFVGLINITMNKKFTDRLESFLSSECDDFGLSYFWEWDEDSECVNATITRDDRVETDVRFKYKEDKDDLLIELTEYSYYTTREFDHTVKYFWMKISPVLFR